MAASMQIDQAGLGAGTPGQARSDGLDDGSLVTLTSITVGTTYKFEFLWTPPGDVDAVSSLVQTGSPEVWTFSPTPGVYGNYRIHLVVDEGLPTEEETIRTFGIRTPAGILIPGFNEKADEDASLLQNGAVEIEASENNEPEPVSSLQWSGWHNFFDKVAKLLDLKIRTRRVSRAFNEQAGTSPTTIGAWKFGAGTLKAASALYMGSSTGTHQVTARLRRVSDPVPVVAQWQVTGGLQNVNVTGGDQTLPADDWYYMEIFSGDAAAQVLLDGADLIVEQDAP